MKASTNSVNGLWQISVPSRSGGSGPGITFQVRTPGRCARYRDRSARNQMFAARARSSGPSTVSPAWPRTRLRAPSAPTTYCDRTVSVASPSRSPDDAGDAVLVLREAGELPSEPDVGARVPGGPQEHRFQHGLRAVRHRLGAGRAVVGGPHGAGPPRFRPGDLQARQGGHPQVAGHQVLRRGDRVEPVADPQVPEDLDGALVDDVRARRVGGAPVPLDDQMFYPVPRQGGGQGQPGGPGPDDQHGHLDSLWTGNRHGPPPPRGITRRVVPRFSRQLTR